MTDTLKVPPHDLDAERGILGAVLLDGQAIHGAQERQDFQRRSPGTIRERSAAFLSPLPFPFFGPKTRNPRGG